MGNRLPSRAKGTDFARILPIIFNKMFKISQLPNSLLFVQYFLSRFTFIVAILMVDILYEIHLISSSRFVEKLLL